MLGADVRPGKNITADRLGPQSLERLTMVVDAYRQLHLPVAVSGGRLSDWQTSVAELMKSALTEYFMVSVTWKEDLSKTTYENGLYRCAT